MTILFIRNKCNLSVFFPFSYPLVQNRPHSLSSPHFGRHSGKLMTLRYYLTSHFSKHTLEPIIEPTFCHLCQRMILIRTTDFPESNDVVLFCCFFKNGLFLYFYFKLNVLISHANLLRVPIRYVQETSKRFSSTISN